MILLLAVIGLALMMAFDKYANWRIDRAYAKARVVRGRSVVPDELPHWWTDAA